MDPTAPPAADPLSWHRRWNSTATSYPADSSVPDLFAACARRDPGAPAIASASGRLSYGEVDAWSDRLADALTHAGLAPGEPVGVLGDRCLQAPVAELGILKAGGAYVPLDHADPPARLALLLAELSIGRIVALPGCEAAPGGVPVLPIERFRPGAGAPPAPRPRPAISPTDPAYVMFTSGSTGVPKAVAVPHRAVVRLVRDTNYVRLSPRDRVANTGGFSFDASVFEIWGALLNGACLVVVDTDTLLSPQSMEKLLREERITVLWLSASVLHHLAGTRPGMFAGLRFLIAGGDVLAPDLVRSVLDAGPPACLVNGYGPTENTTFSSTYRISELPLRAVRVPIGRPVANSTCYVVRDDGELAGVDEEGELWVGGDGVALGYLNSAELTGQRFIADPFDPRPGGRVFRTGDRTRWLPDGNLDFLGRRDRMVKIRGFRVELDEIEAALRSCPGVGEVAVVSVGDEPGGRRFVAYVGAAAAGPDAGPAVASLRAHLTARLPAFMVPGYYVVLPRLPLTASGKVDRRALAARPLARRAAEPKAMDGLEAGLARLWEETLGVDEVAPDDDFFDLGGNSLLAARVFARLQTTFGIDARQGRFLTRRLLADPSLRGSARAVAEARAGTLTRDETGYEIDFRREAALDVPLPAAAGPKATTAAGPRAAPGRLETVLLTGATGFLGRYLLRELLARTSARILCLVRAADAAEGAARLAAAGSRHGLGDLPPGRVVPLVGDLGRPLLGLGEEAFDRYAAEADLVVHSGAYVNFTYPYRQLAAVTVGGTKEILRLAGRYRSAPVHFVSTMAVLAGFGAAGVREVTEDAPSAFPEHLYMGYTETKWVAEELLRQAARVGLPVSVHRPYEISGNLREGAWNLESATCALFKVVVDVGLAPDIALALDLVPVDVLARQIVHIALSGAPGATYHLTNPAPAMFSDMVARLRGHGYRIEVVPFDRWVARVTRFACDHPDHPFTPFVPLWVDRSPRNGLILKEMFFAEHFPAFTREHADAALRDADIAVPPVDDRLLDLYIGYFQRVGFVPTPQAPGRPGSRP